MKVSVIIPAYNAETTIEETVKSILNQTYTNVEIIIVDDGSTDKTNDIVKKLCLFSSNIQLISQVNFGQSYARNMGASKATGEFLIFLDSDDLLEKTYLEKTVNYSVKHSDTVIVYTKGSFIGAKTEEWNLGSFNLKEFFFLNVIPVTALIKRANFIAVGGFDKNLNFFEDWDLWISLLKKFGAKVHRINENLFFYRIHNTKKSLTDQISGDKKKLSKNMLKIYTKHFDYYAENEIYFNEIIGYRHFRKKYYNIWYKRLFYWLTGEKQN